MVNQPCLRQLWVVAYRPIRCLVDADSRGYLQGIT
jgi:hypothetical protein